MRHEVIWHRSIQSTTLSLIVSLINLCSACVRPCVLEDAWLWSMIMKGRWGLAFKASLLLLAFLKSPTLPLKLNKWISQEQCVNLSLSFVVWFTLTTQTAAGIWGCCHVKIYGFNTLTHFWFLPAVYIHLRQRLNQMSLHECSHERAFWHVSVLFDHSKVKSHQKLFSSVFTYSMSFCSLLCLNAKHECKWYTFVMVQHYHNHNRDNSLKSTSRHISTDLSCLLVYHPRLSGMKLIALPWTLYFTFTF